MHARASTPDKCRKAKRDEKHQALYRVKKARSTASEKRTAADRGGQHPEPSTNETNDDVSDCQRETDGSGPRGPAPRAMETNDACRRHALPVSR